MSVVAMPSSGETHPKCSNCGATLVADQSYCLACGRPCSPTRLAFLDVLHAPPPASSAHPPVVGGPPLAGAGPLSMVGGPLPAAGAPPARGEATLLGRHAGTLALISTLLLTALIGLLIGHWLAPGKAPAKQVLELKGLPATLAPAASISGPAGTFTTPSSSASEAGGKLSQAQEAKEVNEAEAPSAKTPAPVKTSSSSLQKLSKLKGHRYTQAINKLVKGDQPIETG
jgi:hypothetical protein